jgi:hypothetical protein
MPIALPSPRVVRGRRVKVISVFVTEHVEAFTASNVISLWLAGAALLLSILTLYLTNLKRAEIEATTLPDKPPSMWSDGWESRGEEGKWPQNPYLRLPMVAYNVGARSGVLTRIILTRLQEVPATDPLFVGAGPTPMLLEDLDEAFKAGTLKRYAPTVRFKLTVPERDLPRLKEHLSRKRAIELTVTFRYLKGRAKRPWPHRPGAVTKETRLDIRVPLEQFAAEIAQA